LYFLCKYEVMNVAEGIWRGGGKREKVSEQKFYLFKIFLVAGMRTFAGFRWFKPVQLVF